MAISICPSCSGAIAVSKSLFSLDLRCPTCSVALRVAKRYTRTLVILSLVVAFALSWQIGGLRECVFGIVPWAALIFYVPVGFLILIVLVRFAPLLVRPSLELRPKHEGITVLNLT